jgi:hypothetical protein
MRVVSASSDDGPRDSLARQALRDIAPGPAHDWIARLLTHGETASGTPGEAVK